MQLSIDALRARLEALLEKGAALELVGDDGSLLAAPIILDDLVIARTYDDGSCDVGYRPIGISADYGDGLVELMRAAYAHLGEAVAVGDTLLLVEHLPPSRAPGIAETRRLRMRPLRDAARKEAYLAWHDRLARTPEAFRDRSRDLHAIPWDASLWG